MNIPTEIYGYFISFLGVKELLNMRCTKYFDNLVEQHPVVQKKWKSIFENNFTTTMFGLGNLTDITDECPLSWFEKIVIAERTRLKNREEIVIEQENPVEDIDKKLTHVASLVERMNGLNKYKYGSAESKIRLEPQFALLKDVPEKMFNDAMEKVKVLTWHERSKLATFQEIYKRNQHMTASRRERAYGK